jgi:hypothetical protein
MQIEPGKHYSFTVGDDQAWHLIGDTMGLIYILICATNYKSKTAYLCLEELQRNFVHACGEKATTAKFDQLSSHCRSMMSVLCKKFNDISKVDKLADISRKVDNVKAVMQDNIDVSLQNCVKLESIHRQAEDLQMQAGVFKKSAGDLKNKMRCEQIKGRLWLAFFVLLLIGGIVGLIMWQTGGKSDPSQAPTSK